MPGRAALSVSTSRRALLVAALGFLGLRDPPPEVLLLRAWLDGWSGLGAVAVGMARQGYDLQLTRYAARGWRATFYASGMEHSAVSAPGSVFESQPWVAVQRAAWAALSLAPEA